MVLGCLAPAGEFSPGSLTTARYQVGLELEGGFLMCLGVWRDGWANRGLTRHIYPCNYFNGSDLPLSHCGELLLPLED